MTLNGMGDYDICPICFWEDDPVQSENPDYRGGANKISLHEAQKNYKEFGACEKRFLKNVKRPSKNDIKDINWKPIT